MSRYGRLAGVLLFAFAVAGSASANDEAQRQAEDASTQDPIAIEIQRRLAGTGIEAIVPDKAERAALEEFYGSPSPRLLWVGPEGLSSAAQNAIAEIGRAGDWGLNAADFVLPADVKPGDGAGQGAADLATAELRLSAAVLKYVRHARGGRMDPTQLSFSIDRQPPLREPKQVLEEIADSDNPAAYLIKQHPQHPQFEKLRQLYLAMRAGTSPAEPAAADEPTTKRDKRKSKSKASDQPETGSARRVLLNMEQWRWMPETLGDTYVWINIPEFTLRLVKNGEIIHSERLIVGKPQNQTPIFSHEMQTIVFHPDWNVPNSIKVKELLPGLSGGGDPLSRQGLRATYRGRAVEAHSIDWSRTDIRNVDIFQPPGPRNVLGVVKFLFPNKHDVYIHDTPTKALFNEQTRAFSHGCMRLRNPIRLAEIILAEDKNWSPDRVAQLIKRGPQKNNVQLDERIPVHITYFTAAVDDEGKPHFWRDVYGHEPLIQMGLDGKAHLIVKKKEDLSPTRARAVARGNTGSRYAETRRSSERGSGERSSGLFGGIFGF